MYDFSKVMMRTTKIVEVSVTSSTSELGTPAVQCASSVMDCTSNSAGSEIPFQKLNSIVFVADTFVFRILKVSFLSRFV